jgi:hypothetical protein
MPSMMKAPHSKGANCPMCNGGQCRMAEGGKVHHPDQRQKHERGVNTQDTDDGKRGESVAGVAVRAGGKRNMRDAKDLHRETIDEQRAIKGPTSGRSGFAEGGAIGEPDMEDESGDEELSHGIGKELIGAFESKDHKKVMGALEAAVLHCMSKQDPEEY